MEHFQLLARLFILIPRHALRTTTKCFSTSIGRNYCPFQKTATITICRCQSNVFKLTSFSNQSRDIFETNHLAKTSGAFHSTKITGSNFRNFCWSNGTRPTASQNSRSGALQHRACWVKLLCLKMVDFLNIFAAFEHKLYHSL